MPTSPDCVAKPAHPFRPTQKLRQAAEFDRARRQGRRHGDALFGMNYLANELGYPRLGLAIGNRAVGNAVNRNRLKRQCRESFRLAQHELPAVDIMLTARVGAREATNAQVRASLERLWRHIQRG